MTMLWPYKVLRPAGIDAFLLPRAVSGPPTLDGSIGYSRSSLGVWSIVLTDVTCTTPDAVRCFRAIAGLLNGPTTPILVPVYDWKQAPFPLVGGRPLTDYGAIPFSDGSLFDDGAGFSQPVIVASAAAASLRATSLSIAVAYGADLQSSQFFSMGDWLYQILTVDAVDRSGTSPVFSVTIQPELREAIADGQDCNFDNPTCRCLLATPEEMRLPLTNRGFVGTKTVQFAEDDV